MTTVTDYQHLTDSIADTPAAMDPGTIAPLAGWHPDQLRALAKAASGRQAPVRRIGMTTGPACRIVETFAVLDEKHPACGLVFRRISWPEKTGSRAAGVPKEIRRYYFDLPS